MAKITELSALADLEIDDLIHVVDVSDPDMANSGTNKKVTIESLANSLIAQELVGRPISEGGGAGQYYRGDGTWANLDAAAVQLGNVTNESKATMFTSPAFTGTPRSGNTTTNSLNSGALWLNGTSGALLFDNTGHKRIGWNDGGNFNIRAGNYSTDGTNDVYAVEGANTNAGAAKITLTCDGNLADGAIDFRVAPSGAAGATISYSNHVSIAKDRFTVNGTGVNVGIGTTSPGAKLNVVDSTSSDAVRITQTGTGNALVVEDSTSPDNSPFVVDNSGKVIIGSSANIANGLLQVGTNVGTSSTTAQIISSNSGASIWHARSNNNATVVAEDVIGGSDYRAYDGSSYVVASRVTCVVDGTPGTNDMPGRLVFSTSANGSTNPTERMRIASTGNVGIGTGATSPAAKLTVLDGSTNDAVRITQTGNGNALVVEDSANPDSTPVVINANGALLVGHTTSVQTPFGNAPLQVVAGASIIRYSDVFQPRVDICRSRSNTTGANQIVNSNDIVGEIAFCGADGTNYVPAGLIAVQVDGTPGTGDMPGCMRFLTTADGSSAPTERMRITNNGTVFIGNGTTSTTPNSATLSATGGSGPDTAGADFTIRAGIGTGTASGGSIVFNASSPLAATQSGTTTINTVAQRARLLPAGQMIIGSSTSAFATRFGPAATSTDIFPNLQILSNTAASAKEVDSSAALIARFSNNADSARLYFAKSRSGTTGSHASVSTFDSVGQISFGASDGTKILEGARISATVNARSVVAATAIASGKRYKIRTVGTTNWVSLGAPASPTPAVNTIFTATANGTLSSGDGDAYLEPETDQVPVVLQFLTSSASGVSERMRIGETGNVGIGTTGPGARLDVVGPALTLTNPNTYAVYIANSGGSNGDLTFASNSTGAFIQSWGGKPLAINSQGNNVGIGTSTPNSRALLHLNSTTGGFLPPVMNTTQRNAMGAVPAGLMIYNTDQNAIQFHNGTAWQQLSFAAAP